LLNKRIFFVGDWSGHSSMHVPRKEKSIWKKQIGAHPENLPNQFGGLRGESPKEGLTIDLLVGNF